MEPTHERLTIDQLRTRYDGEWVMVEDPECDDHMEILSGKVIAHHHDRLEFDRVTMKLHPKLSAVLCFAKEPEGMVYVL